MIDPQLLDRALGAYLGLAIGDALGGTVEFLTRQEIQQRYGVHCKMIGGGWLHLAPGQVTDDTEMSLCLGRSLARCAGLDIEDVCEEFALWLKSAPIDVGNTCRRGIRRYILEKTVESPPSDGDGGNGACMRNLPVAMATLGDGARLEAWTLAQCRITHNHPLSDAGSLALGRMVHRLLAGEGIPAARTEAMALVERYRNFRFDTPGNTPSAYIVDTVRAVLHTYFVTDSFRSCLIETVNLGGDADTTGALAGMLAGATYGASTIPSAWLKRLDRAVVEEIRVQTPALLALA